MGTRKIFIKKLNCFGEEFDYTVVCIDNDYFLRVWDIETLKKILNTQLAHENYEMAELVKKHIRMKQIEKEIIEATKHENTRRNINKNG